MYTNKKPDSKRVLMGLSGWQMKRELKPGTGLLLINAQKSQDHPAQFPILHGPIVTLAAPLQREEFQQPFILCCAPLHQHSIHFHCLRCHLMGQGHTCRCFLSLNQPFSRVAMHGSVPASSSYRIVSGKDGETLVFLLLLLLLEDSELIDRSSSNRVNA